ncbi:PREDICTED: transcription initiation factor IIE subunit beta-like [Tarenaya hassleriana]|uniref:transcription initiation factor IIE subunit beta-like n=1 Tax=Tarenaya hassleriana TaxID=28532 RepID=UPI00053C555A|nr:PREDICTED: transcription initiation factor IIE subunit beta-like [Tarenaya hassleriana]
MDLKEKLDKFQKQQQRCQSTLSSIAARASSARPSVSTAVNGKPATPIKFSDQTELYKQINSIRKAPVGAQMKRVIEFLLETRQALTPEEIKEACYVDMISNKIVFDNMKNNPKVHYDGRRFSYKAKHDVKDKIQLLSLIRKYPEGIAVVELKDTYRNVMGDLQALKASGHIWLLSNADSREDIAYPNDFKGQIRVDDDLKHLFRIIELPTDMLDVEKELQKSGMKPVMNTARRRAAAQIRGISSRPKQRKKRQGISKRTKLTNVHLPELFQSLNGGRSRH